MKHLTEARLPMSGDLTELAKNAVNDRELTTNVVILQVV